MARGGPRDRFARGETTRVVALACSEGAFTKRNLLRDRPGEQQAACKNVAACSARREWDGRFESTARRVVRTLREIQIPLRDVPELGVGEQSSA